MRILHVVGKLDRGGAETWLVQVLRHMDRQKYQMDFLVHSTDPGAYDDEVRALGSRIIPCLSPSNPALYARNFRRVLREYGPYEVVHSHVYHYSGYILMLAAASGVPIRIAHSHTNARSAEGSMRPTRKAYGAAMRFLIRLFATNGLAVSTEAGDHLFKRNWQASPKWKLHHLGIDLSRFDISVDRDSVRASIGIPSDVFVIGHVGRFVEAKNHSFLVDVAREVVRMEPKAVFLLVGDGPLRPAIEAKVASHSLSKNVVFAGLRSDVPTLMKGAMDLFLFPSVYEGLPLTLLEAQTAGLRCLVSDVVSPETDIIASLIFRESLAKPAREWAERVIEAQRAAVAPGTVCASQCLQGRSIEASVELLASAYYAIETP